MGSPKRRDIGHGALAQRALEAVIPTAEEFPYTIRLVSETLESNGSSSMGSVCGSTLALMDAGVPITAPVSGIAMGLVKEGDDYVILTDIQGAEDHLGDMDFKVAGTRDGITALQMDIKITGVSREIMERALTQAKEARVAILGRMLEAIPEPREALAEHAPRISTIQINPEYIGMVIGKGGETIRSLESEYEVQIDIEEDGTILVYATEGTKGDAAIAAIAALTKEPEVGDQYTGKRRQDDRLRRVRRAEEGHRRPAARLERRARAASTTSRTSSSAATSSTCWCRRSTRPAAASASSWCRSTRTAASSRRRSSSSGRRTPRRASPARSGRAATAAAVAAAAPAASAKGRAASSTTGGAANSRPAAFVV